MPLVWASNRFGKCPIDPVWVCVCSLVWWRQCKCKPVQSRVFGVFAKRETLFVNGLHGDLIATCPTKLVNWNFQDFPKIFSRKPLIIPLWPCTIQSKNIRSSQPNNSCTERKKSHPHRAHSYPLYQTWVPFFLLGLGWIAYDNNVIILSFLCMFDKRSYERAGSCMCVCACVHSTRISTKAENRIRLVPFALRRKCFLVSLSGGKHRVLTMRYV